MSKADRHSEAMLGIHLAKGRGRAEGSPPSDEELALLIDGQLEESRRLEVLSHLAHRPERYRQWLSLADMEADEQASHAGLLAVLTRGINNWLVDWRYAAGGLGAMAAIVLLVNQMALPPAEYGASSESAAYSPSTNSDEDTPQFVMPAKPAADGASRQQELKMEMAEERSFSSQAPVAAKRLASPPVQTQCLQALEPATGQAGTLCAVRTGNDTHELRWTAANSGEALPLTNLPDWPLQLLISQDNLRLAVQVNEAIYVYDLPEAFRGETSRSQLPFTAGTSRMRWHNNELLISVMQALGDSDDDLVYRYNPETGEIQPPP